jgi:predicted secreted protein
MRLSWLACTLALVACAPKTAEENVSPPSAPAAASGAVPAPSVAGVTRHLTAADKGATVTLAVGSKFSVDLVGVPTAGYVWSVAEKPAFLSEPTETSGNTTTAQSRPGFAGGNHWEVFAFEVKGAGEGTLKLEQRRPWEPKSEPATDTFSVTIKAQ